MKSPDGSRVRTTSKAAGKTYAKCMLDFKNRIKHDFRNNGMKWAVDVGIEEDFPEADIEEGYMTFTNEEILSCFLPVVNRILELIITQINAVKAQSRALQVCSTIFSKRKLSDGLIGNYNCRAPLSFRIPISNDQNSCPC